MGLHITKVAVACETVDDLRERLAGRAAGGEVAVVTRYKPTRAAELIGGSLYWIHKHRLIGRQTILRFAETEEGRCAIWLDARLIPVATMPKRAHQGWRYLEASAAPPDLGGAAASDLAVMPPRMVEELAALALL
ncbi:DUF1489 family protein [Sphingomonas sp. ID0503]|uniref:DUF1489 family protein n=1 Tax=Sphingomonas sp. ID0503 TaxID=3399691 RepID=UPI003AFACB12